MPTALAAAAALALAALPTPPGTLTFPARIGEVTFDHPAHLARRETCKTCHGDGPVRPIALGKDRAHDLCAGCHKAKGGPTACSGCHAVASWEKAAAKEAAEAPAPEGGAAAR